MARAAERRCRPSVGPGTRAWTGLILAILGVAGTSTFMKLAGTDPLVTAFWRLALSAALLLPLQTWRRAGREGAGLVQHRQGIDGRVLTAGALLALHFALWVTSLTMTSVLSSLVFVTMNPLFVAVLGLLFFHERTSPLLWVAVAVVTVGGVFIGVWSGTAANVGNLLALGGALAASLYLIVGRKASRSMDPLSYNLGAFTWAAIFLAGTCLVSGRPLLTLSGRAFFWLAVTAVLGQTVGHGLINASLKWFQPQFVALMLLWEPILGSALAFLVLGDRPSSTELVGGAVILVGLALGIISSSRSPGEP